MHLAKGLGVDTGIEPRPDELQAGREGARNRQAASSCLQAAAIDLQEEEGELAEHARS
jgi:hypothetical protein